MIYLLDTVAIIRHFTSTGKIGRRAKNIFDYLHIKEMKKKNEKSYTMEEAKKELGL